jgi:hypothetical protein
VTPERFSRRYSFSRKVAMATSNDAELDNPLPRGTLEQMTALKEVVDGRSGRYWKMVP